MRHKADGKRKLFRSITSRISHHNHAAGQERVVSKDDIKDTSNIHNYERPHLTAHSSVSSQVGGQQYHQMDKDHHAHNGEEPQLPHAHSCHQQQHDTHRASNAQAVPPATKDGDSSNLSCMEGVKRAPGKMVCASERSDSTTPTSKFKVRSSGRVGNETSSRRSRDNMKAHASNPAPYENMESTALSPSTETSVGSEFSFMNKSESLVIHEDNKFKINEYDYKTFSTKHPLRLSKVKAFEQAEMTTKRYFSKYGSNTNSSTSHYSSHRTSGSSKVAFSGVTKVARKRQNCDIIIQIPEMSETETGAMLETNTVEERILDRGKGNKNNSSYGNEGKLGYNSVEARMNMMKNVLRPLSREEIISNRLETSRVARVFQNTHEFLTKLEPQEIELLELMNDEFENGMSELQRDYRQEQKAKHTLVDYDVRQAARERMANNKGRANRAGGVSDVLSSIIRKRIKQDLLEEETFALNCN